MAPRAEIRAGRREKEAHGKSWNAGQRFDGRHPDSSPVPGRRVWSRKRNKNGAKGQDPTDMAHGYIGGVSPSARWQFGFGNVGGCLVGPRGGEVALTAMSGSIAMIAIVLPAAGDGAIVGRLPRTSRINVVPAYSGTFPALILRARAGRTAQRSEKEKNEANREIRNTRSDEDLNQDGSETARRTNPNRSVCSAIGPGSVCSVTGSRDPIRRDRATGAALPVTRRLATGRTIRVAWKTPKRQGTKRHHPTE